MIELLTLGRLNALSDEGQSIDGLLAQPKRVAVLVYLAVAAPGTYQRRDAVMGTFWPDDGESKARKALRQTLWKLRQHLGDDVVVTRGEDEVGVDPSLLVCDVHAFDEAVASGDLEQAAGLYKGSFLHGFFLKGALEFDHWIDGERDRLGRAYTGVLEGLIEDCIERQDWDAGVEWARRLASHNPYSTSVALTYMEAMAAAGDRASALRYAERHASRMRADLEAEPSPDVEAYAEELRKKPSSRKSKP